MPPPEPAFPFFEPRSIGDAIGSYVESFSFTTKCQHQRDLLTFEPCTTAEKNGLAELCLYRNPHVEGRGDWEKTKITTLRNPIALTYADISLNGHNDVIIADDYGTIEKVNPLGGRVSWLENVGTSSDEWVRREIGRFPGTHTLKSAGRFTNNYSLQILAIPLTLPKKGSHAHFMAAESPSPLIIYTQPQNIASGRPWLSSVAFSTTFRLVSDACVIHQPNASGLLDKILLASKEGITLVWWEMERWHARNIGPGLVKNLSAIRTDVRSGAGLVNVAKVAKDDVGYIVSVEPLHGPVLSLYVKSLSVESDELQHAHWSRFVLDDFSTQDGVITQIRCADLDGDGEDEVIALVKAREGSIPCVVEGLWYYKVVDLAKGDFEKWKIADGDIASLVAGDFQFRGKMDIVTVSWHLSSILPRVQGPTLHSNAFYHPIICASLIRQSSVPGLILSTPRPSAAKSAYELPLFRLFDITFSLVVLPPGESFLFVRESPGENGVKVLHGRVTWTRPSGETISVGKAMSRGACRSRVAVRSMVVDARAPGVTASAEGAVFLRLNFGDEIANDTLEIHNLIPSPYPSNVRNHQFKWATVLAADECSHTQVFTLDTFRLRFIDEPDNPDFPHVHFTACRKFTSSRGSTHQPTLIPAPSSPLPYSTSRVSICQVRACIVNGSECGGIYAEYGCLNGSNHEGTPPLAWMVPCLTEVAPMWCVGNSGEPVLNDGNVLYPSIYGWLSDVTPLQNGQHIPAKTRQGRWGDMNIDKLPKRKDSLDVWMDVDFAPFNLELNREDVYRERPWLHTMSVSCLVLVLVLVLRRSHSIIL